MTREHVLKCWDTYWDATARGDKTFDVRFNDRGYQAGDTVVLQRWNREKDDFTRHRSNGHPYYLRRKIKYILPGGQFGIEPGWIVLGLGKIRESNHDRNLAT